MHRPAALKSPAPVLGEKKPAHFGQGTERGWWSSESPSPIPPSHFRRPRGRWDPPVGHYSVGFWSPPVLTLPCSGSPGGHTLTHPNTTQRGEGTLPPTLSFFINSASLPSDFIKSSRPRGVSVIRHGFSPVGLIPLPERCLSHPIPLVFLQPFD